MRLFSIGTISGLISLLTGGCVGQMASPSAEAVQESVRNVVGLNDASEAARMRIARWGNAALPHLRDMALNPTDERDGFLITTAINEISTPEAAELLLEIAERKTKIEPHHAVQNFMTMMHDKRKRKHLVALPNFKPTLFKLADEANWGSQSIIAGIMADLNWDAAPVIEKMLKSDQLSTRESAAAAIEKLTGKRPQIARPALNFPSSAIRRELIEQIGTLPKSGWMSPSSTVGEWFDSRRGILQWREGALRFFGTDLQQKSETPLSTMLHDFILAPRENGQKQLIALASDGKKPTGNYFLSIDPAGNELWKNRPPGASVNSIAAYYGDDGAVIGAVIGCGGEDGIIVTNLKGEQLHQIKNQYVIYQVRTHPKLPKLYMSCGGQIELFREGEQVASNRVEGGDARIYAHDAVLFPDETGEPAVIVTGPGEGGTPTTLRLNSKLEPVWTAVTPNDIHDLDLIEVDLPRESFVIGASDGGLVYIFNAMGELLHEAPLGLSSTDPKIPLYGLKAGMLDEKTPGFIIGTLDGILVFKLNVSALSN